MEPNRGRSERNWRAFANSIPVIFGWKKKGRVPSTKSAQYFKGKT